MKRRHKLNKRQVLIQEILSANSRGIADVTKFEVYVFGLDANKVGLLKKKSYLKGAYHRRRPAKNSAIAPSGEIDKHVD